MTATIEPTTGDTVTATDRNRFVPWAAELGGQFARYSAGHDCDGTFVAEAYDVLRASGYLALAVPVECGGYGATIEQVAAAQAELARYCGSAALAVAMHLHVTLFAAWRFRRNMPGAAELLRQVATDGIVIVSTGGNDFTKPNGVAIKVDGGYRVSGRKVFASQAPVGDVMSTMFTYDDPADGLRVLSMIVPMRVPGVSIVETWDTMGMRGTGSHDLVIDDVFVGDGQVLSNRPWGVVDPPLTVIISHAMPVIAAVYLGIAEGARDRAIAVIKESAKCTDTLSQRSVGLLDYNLRIARWSLFAAIAEIGPDPAPSMPNVVLAMQAKRAVAEHATAACDLILELVGGRAYFRKAGFEQAARDVRGLQYHPFPPEPTLLHAGRFALDQPATEI